MDIAICDDDKPIRDELVGWIKEIDPSARIVQFDSGEGLLSENEYWDIIFLDIEMSGMSGMEAAEAIRGRDGGKPVLVFVTGYAEYMNKAFDVEAFHYLLKPISKEKFVEIYKRASKRISEKDNKSKTLVLKAKGESISVPTDDIRYIESAKKKIIVHTDKDEIESYGKIVDIAETIGTSFYRCHRCYVVNLKHVASYRASEIRLDTSEIVPIAQKSYRDFLTAYSRYLRGGAGLGAF